MSLGPNLLLFSLNFCPYYIHEPRLIFSMESPCSQRICLGVLITQDNELSRGFKKNTTYKQMLFWSWKIQNYLWKLKNVYVYDIHMSNHHIWLRNMGVKKYRSKTRNIEKKSIKAHILIYKPVEIPVQKEM